MRKFAFIFHPHDLEFFADGFSEPDLKNKNPELVKNAMKWFPPFKRAVATGIRSNFNNQEIEGLMILVTLLPEQMTDLNDKFALQRFVEAAQLSERLGADVIGLGAYAALYGRHGLDIAAAVKTPVTTGNSYTLAVAPDVILNALAMRNKEPSKAVITILGATGILGSYCLRALIGKAGVINLLSGNYKRLHDLPVSGPSEYKTRINMYSVKDSPKYVQESDLIMVANGKYAPFVDIKKVKKEAIMYDGTYPKTFTDKHYRLRSDLLFVDGGIILPPGSPDFHFSFGFPPRMVFPCMAETMILTLEQIYESYSLGRVIDFAKAGRIYELGKKHGFTLAGFSHRGKMIEGINLTING